MSTFSQQEILAGLAELVTEETGLPAADVQPEKSFVDDLDIDSLSMMTIVVNAQDKFNVEIPDEAVTELKDRRGRRQLHHQGARRRVRRAGLKPHVRVVSEPTDRRHRSGGDHAPGR